MRLKTKEAIEYLSAKKEIEWEILKADTKWARTLKQNRMFKWLFSEIWKHQWWKWYEVQWFFMKALFGVKSIKMFWEIQDIPNISSTTQLSKEQAIDLIDSILNFIRHHDIPCKYSPREIESLYASFTN